jgi:hypothetical protein
VAESEDIMSLQKWAVDEKAKKYWQDFYKEYGKSWVRDIPRKVKKAFVEGKRVASSEDADLGIIVPVAKAITASNMTLEGVLHTRAGKKLVFQATFNHDGDITHLDSLPLTQD